MLKCSCWQETRKRATGSGLQGAAKTHSATVPVCNIGVAHGRLDLGLAEELANNRQILTKYRCRAGVRVAGVVNSFLLLVGVCEGYAAGEALNFGDGAKGNRSFSP